MATDYDAPRVHPEDSETDSFEEVKAAAGTKTAQQPNIDEDETAAAESFELPGADLSGVELTIEVTPQQRDEFTCMRCFLVRHRSQMAEPEICLDCA